MQTLHLHANDADLARAAGLLQSGDLVAFPTETVYGLGADARNGKAVASVYEAKGRPSFNPLIVHVPDVASAQKYVMWNETAQLLAPILARRVDDSAAAARRAWFVIIGDRWLGNIGDTRSKPSYRPAPIGIGKCTNRCAIGQSVRPH